MASRTPVPDTVSFSRSRGVEAFLFGHSVQVAAILAAYAALRILVFAATFPLANHEIDEKNHFLSILMYAHGHFPGKQLPLIDSGFARDLLMYWSPEYATSEAEMRRAGIYGPLCRLTPQERELALQGGYYGELLNRWPTRENYEAQGAPLYYIVAATWYRLGATLGIKSWHLIYWVRFLNAFLYGLFVWFSFQFIRKVYPDRLFLYLAVPSLLAAFPQDVFFFMNRDVLSPLLCALALTAMAAAHEQPFAQWKFLTISSFLVGLAFLGEVSNFVLYVPLAMTAWICLRQSACQGRRRAWILSGGALSGALLPVLWMGRNYLVMGDLTGGRAKTHFLTWTIKPLADIFHHPLFSFHGLAYFLVTLTGSFWRGEDNWHGVAMRSVRADSFYLLSSAIFLSIFAFDFVRRQGTVSPLQHWAEFSSAFLVVSSVLFLAFISLIFDFHEGVYPSRAYPYFVSGRIVIGTLLPFVLMYARGLELVTDRLRKWVSPVTVLAILMLFITACELWAQRAAFSSHFGFFQLLVKC
jgi:hypothetical protein